jgi:predicted ATPase/DNA-binding winged helix-turn-helix (wHTH) protein
MATPDARPVYTSGDWDIDLVHREMRWRGGASALGGRAFEIVEVLVRSAGRLVDKKHLVREVWSGAVIEENTLHVHISAIRKALGHDRGMLQTVAGRGYRLLGDWAVRQDATPMALNDKPPAPSPRLIAGNLPSPATALVGRTTAIAELVELLATRRMITLTGAGGIGKTALALETARTAISAFEGAVYFVDLAPVSNGAQVSSTVAGTLDIRSGSGELTQAALALALGAKPALVVLDNCEHVVDAAVDVAESILRACPRVHVLATSREVLRIEGEFVFRVSPLSVPNEDDRDLESVLSSGAAQLFIERTQARGASLTLDDGSIAPITVICRRLDGIPLALEIAAARVATLGLDSVSSRLDGQFAGLAGGRRTALRRHQTLRATLDWSYALLSEAEQALLRRLSLFAGYFTISAAINVASGVGMDVAEIPDYIAGLAMKSLLSMQVGTAKSQFRMLQTTRDFGLELLRSSDEHDLHARRHASLCCNELSGAEAAANVLGEDQWLQRYGGHIDDVRSALRWSLEQGHDVQLGGTLTILAVPLWTRLSLLNECRHFVELALGRLDWSTAGDQREMRLRAALANVLLNSAGPVPEATKAATEARALAEHAGDSDFQLRAILLLWNGCFSKGEIRESKQLALEFQKIAEQSPDPSDQLLGFRLSATSEFVLGNLRQAEAHVDRMLAGYAALPHGSNFLRFGVAQLASAHALRVLILAFRGFVDQASKLAEECLAEVLGIGNAATICSTVSTGCIPPAIMVGDLETADRYTRIMLQHAERAGLSGWHEMAQSLVAIIEIKKGNLSSGLSGLRKILDHRTDFVNARYALQFAEFAEALGRDGNVVRGVSIIDEMLRSEQGLMHLEQLRIKAGLTLKAGSPAAAAAAERALRRGIELAHEQGAHYQELRLALDLAHLMEAEGERVSAHVVLASIYDGFTEGFGTDLLVTARQTLDRLAA